MHEAPPTEKLCEHYSLRVNGREVPVYSCRVSAVPFNQGWPGYQRPKDQTESAGFAYWEMDGAVTVEVTAGRAFRSAVVRPTSRGIKAKVQGSRATFTIDRPGQFTVEFDGLRAALHLFADPLSAGVPRPDDPDVLYFGPGVHRPGRIALRTGQRVHVAAGAVVYTRLDCRKVSDVRITGRGIIDSSEFERGDGGCILLDDCSDVTIEGVILRDSPSWCLSMFGCRSVSVSRIKLIGMWRYNADGIDVCNSQDVTIQDSFVRAFDDTLAVKGVRSDSLPYSDRAVRNVRFSRCVLWCDWGRAMEIGAETCAPEIADVVFDNCDIIRTTHAAMEIRHGDGAHVRNIRFRNIRVEIDDANPDPQFQRAPGQVYTPDPSANYRPDLIELIIRRTPFSQDEHGGTIRDVLFADIDVTGTLHPQSHLAGLDAEHDIRGVTIRSLRFNGVLAGSLDDACIRVSDFVSDVQFEGP